MRTTIDLPNDLFRQVKARAALDGTTLKDLITRYVKQGILHSSRSTRKESRQRSELPIVREATGRPLLVFSNADLYRILDEEETGLERRRRSA